MALLFDKFFDVNQQLTKQDSYQNTTTNTSNYAYDSTYSPTFVINSAGATTSPSLTKEQRAVSSLAQSQASSPNNTPTTNDVQQTPYLLIGGLVLAGIVAWKVL